MSNIPRVLKVMLEEDRLNCRRRPITFSPKVDEREFMMACILFATGKSYANMPLSVFIMEAIKHFITTGLLKHEKELYNEAVYQIQKLRKTRFPEDVEKVLDKFYN